MAGFGIFAGLFGETPLVQNFTRRGGLENFVQFEVGKIEKLFFGSGPGCEGAG